MSEKIEKIPYRTQKARGIYLLAAGKLTGFPMCFASTPWKHSITTLPLEMPNERDFPLFARPCPERPRHGFVESRLVKTYEDLLNLFVEVRKVDPNAEVVCMPRFTARVSALASDAAVVYAEGSDGATAGKGQQFVIPCCSNAFTLKVRSMAVWTVKQWIEEDIKEGAYIELVEHEGDMVAVQVRDGPSHTSATKVWLPHDEYYISDVFPLPADAEHDLIAWEQQVAELPKTTALWLPGQTLASHFAVHGIARQLPVFCTDDPPAVGVYHNRPDGAPEPLGAFDYLELGGLVAAYDRLALAPKPPAWPFHSNKPEVDEARALLDRTLFWDAPYYLRNEERRWSVVGMQHLATSIATLHAMSHWGREPHLMRLRAFGALVLAKYLTAACVGEARHFYRHGPGVGNKYAKSAVPWTRKLGFETCDGVDRLQVYDRTLNLRLNDLPDLLEGCIQDFSGEWGSYDEDTGRFVEDTSYGGPRWQEASEAALDLVNALLRFMDNPTGSNWALVVVNYNRGVNLVHNGGKLLTKWMSDVLIDTVAAAPQLGFLNPWTMRLVFPKLAPDPKAQPISTAPIENCPCPRCKEHVKETKRRRRQKRLRNEAVWFPSHPPHHVNKDDPNVKLLLNGHVRLKGIPFDVPLSLWTRAHMKYQKTKPYQVCLPTVPMCDDCFQGTFDKLKEQRKYLEIWQAHVKGAATPAMVSEASDA